MPLSPLLATWLVDRGHDAVHAVLDYPRLPAISRSTEPSLILFRGGNWSEADVRTRMATLLASFEAKDIESSILVVERERLRRRHLPLS